MSHTVPFQKEFANILLRRMHTVGLKEKSNKDSDIIIQYVTLLKRIILPKPREILLASDFFCSTNLENGWEIFKTKVKTGEDINPHQFTTMKRKGYTDLMLASWQIHHFHLGKNMTSSGYMERTGDILYAMIKDDKFLALKIDVHNHWSDKELLNIAHDNWLELTSDWDVDATPVVDYTSDEISKIRKMGVNVIVARKDGYATIGGYGITTAGTSIEASLNLMDLNRMFENAYNEVKVAVGDVYLELAFDEYSNICIVDPISMRGKAVCNIPDISQYAYLF